MLSCGIFHRLTIDYKNWHARSVLIRYKFEKCVEGSVSLGIPRSDVTRPGHTTVIQKPSSSQAYRYFLFSLRYRNFVGLEASAKQATLLSRSNDIRRTLILEDLKWWLQMVLHKYSCPPSRLKRSGCVQRRFLVAYHNTPANISVRIWDFLAEQGVRLVIHTRHIRPIWNPLQLLTVPQS